MEQLKEVKNCRGTTSLTNTLYLSLMFSILSIYNQEHTKWKIKIVLDYFYYY